MWTTKRVILFLLFVLVVREQFPPLLQHGLIKYNDRDTTKSDNDDDKTRLGIRIEQEQQKQQQHNVSLSRTTTNVNNNTTVTDVIYGHVHMAKTAGTTINGELASRCQHICGHKGYTYDFYQYMEKEERIRQQQQQRRNDTQKQLNVYNKVDRGRIPTSTMNEIGYEDCDWISLEAHANTWRQFANWPIPIELHIPCRDPLEHLMSQCNMAQPVRNASIHLDCTSTANLSAQVQHCLVHMNRFSMALLKVPNFRVKCFNSTVPEGYVQYMANRLQSRRIRRPYVYRSTNSPRNTSKECLWSHHDFRIATRTYLLTTQPYYRFCRSCMGTENELSLPVIR